MNALSTAVLVGALMFIPSDGGANDVFMPKDKRCTCHPEKVVPAVFIIHQTKKRPRGFLI